MEFHFTDVLFGILLGVLSRLWVMEADQSYMRLNHD
jgi:hypothetical protein